MVRPGAATASRRVTLPLASISISTMAGSTFGTSIPRGAICGSTNVRPRAETAIPIRRRPDGDVDAANLRNVANPSILPSAASMRLVSGARVALAVPSALDGRSRELPVRETADRPPRPVSHVECVLLVRCDAREQRAKPSVRGVARLRLARRVPEKLFFELHHRLERRVEASA